ncbi:MAG: glycosyltransferase family 2 protein [Candidatus Tokpelaia sp.]|nr:MAG: glycosyltransferase family 2 protein [Candidatus Tokpelaia sp.]
MRQSKKADAVILYLAEEQFPQGEDGLPASLLQLKREGLSIGWYHNIKSYTKLIPARKAWPDALIITADDDILYPDNFIELLYKAWENQPHMIHAHRCHRIRLTKAKGITGIAPYNNWEWYNKPGNRPPSYLNFFTGVGGVLYPPASLADNVFDEENFMRLCPTNDDIWFWAMAVLNATKINHLNAGFGADTLIDGTQKTALWPHNRDGGNDSALQALLRAWPQILPLLVEEDKRLHRQLLLKKILRRLPFGRKAAG